MLRPVGSRNVLRPPPGKGSTPPHSPGGLVTRSPSLRFPRDCVRDVTTSSCLLLCALGMPESESVSTLRFGLGGGWRNGRGLYYGEPPSSGAPDTCQEGKRKGNSFPGAGRGVAYPTPYTPALGSPGLVRSGLLAAVTGLDPLGSSGRAESEEPDGPRSVPKRRQGACAGLDLLLRVPGDRRGVGGGPIEERWEARARAAGTWALAREPRGAAQRIPHIPARPRFRRHVVALRAALTVRLGEGAHPPLGSACGPPRVRDAEAWIDCFFVFCFFKRNKESCLAGVMTLICKGRQEESQALLVICNWVTIHLRNRSDH